LQCGFVRENFSLAMVPFRSGGSTARVRAGF
jgi:hypothetical protein